MTLSRRTMIGSTAALTATTLLSQANARAADEKTTVNFALVGLGSLSTNQIAPALQKTKHAKLVGIVTGTPEKEKIWADKYSIKPENIYNYENFDKIAANDNIDVVYIVLPNGMHKEFTVRGANASMSFSDRRRTGRGDGTRNQDGSPKICRSRRNDHVDDDDAQRRELLLQHLVRV